MRFFTAAAAALFATVALAQNNAINIPSGQSTLDVTAGQPVTITWSDPSSGTVTIKLQQAGSITPTSGIVLASGIAASDETATFTIDPSEVNSHLYTIEIIDDTDPSNYNFSPNFGIANAQSTATGITSASASASASTTSTVSDSSSATGSTTGSATSATSSETTSSTSGTSSGSSSSTTTSASATTTKSSSSSSASSSAATTTSAPDSTSGAADLKIRGGLVALVALVAVAVL